VSTLALAMSLHAARFGGETYDEPHHLAYARRLLDSGETERRTNLQFNSKTPALVPNVLLRQYARWTLGIKDPDELRLFARLPSVLCLAALVLTVFLATRRLLSATAAHLATLIVALDPNLIAHGSLATVDVAYALSTLWALLAGWMLIERPGAGRALLLGLGLGLANLVKFTAPLLLFALGLLALARPRQVFTRRVLSLVPLSAAVVLLTICGGYLFNGVLAPLSSTTWKSDAVTRLARALPALALPLPIDFLTGLDGVIGSERERAWNVVVLGRLYPSGIWFYFFVLWLLKTPLALLGAVVLGIGRVLASRAALGGVVLFLSLSLLVHLAYFSFVFRTQVGYRFVLMCLPLAAIVAAAGLAPLLSRRAAPVVVGVAVALTLAELAVFLGNPLSFTNAAVQPKRRVFRLIADSNVDWGQNDEKIGGWLERRRLDSHLNPPHLLPGDNVIGLNLLAGVAAPERYRWLRENLDPGGHLGHTYLWFDVSPDLYERFLREARTLAPRPDDERLCATAGASVEHAAPLRFPEVPAQHAALLCLASVGERLVTIEAHEGRLVIARAGVAARDADSMHPGERLVFRLLPGVHALVATRTAGFRGTLQAGAGPLAVSIHVVPVDRRGLLATP
jgi:hypothetical protein